MGSNKTKELYGLHKIPLEVLLKESRVEVGKLEAYIDELEHDKLELIAKVKALETALDSDLTKEERTQYREQLYETTILKSVLGTIKHMREDIKQMKSRNRELKKEILDLTIQCAQYLIDDIEI